MYTCGYECLSSTACLYPLSMAASSPRAHSLLLPDNTSTKPATLDWDWFSWREGNSRTFANKSLLKVKNLHFWINSFFNKWPFERKNTPESGCWAETAGKPTSWEYSGPLSPSGPCWTKDHLSLQVCEFLKFWGSVSVVVSVCVSRHLPMRQVVSLEDQCQWGAEFGVDSDGAPQLGLSQSSPGLHLHQHSETVSTEEQRQAKVVCLLSSPVRQG